MNRIIDDVHFLPRIIHLARIHTQSFPLVERWYEAMLRLHRYTCPGLSRRSASPLQLGGGWGADLHDGHKVRGRASVNECMFVSVHVSVRVCMSVCVHHSICSFDF